MAMVLPVSGPPEFSNIVTNIPVLLLHKFLKNNWAAYPAAHFALDFEIPA